MTAGERLRADRGTPEFWPPEGPRDRTADLYGLGKTLYLLLTGADLGRFPEFAGGTLKVPGDDPRAEGLRRVILRACHDDPARRFPSAGAMRQALARLRRRKPWGLAVAGVGVAVVLAVGFFLLGRPGPALPALEGYVDVRIWEKGNPDRFRLRLSQEGALPLKAGDLIRIEAQLNRPAYLYLVWVDTEGKAHPAYPWVPGKWDQRPAAEKPVDRLNLPEESAPEGGAGGWVVPEGKPGMATVLLLARDSPLPREVDVPALFAGLPVPEYQNPFAVVWFRNGEVVRDEAERAAAWFNVQQINDPVLQMQALLKGRLQPHFRYTRAVSFANGGK
jgi:hypothetical protein